MEKSDDFYDGFRIGYLAAIVDGEGSIQLGMQRAGTYLGKYKDKIYKRKKDKFQPRVQVANDDYMILEAVSDMIGFGHIGGHGDGHGCFYIVKIEQILSLLRNLAPYFISEKKRRLSKLLMEYCELRLKKLDVFCQAPMGKREKEIWEEMRVINAG